MDETNLEAQITSGAAALPDTNQLNSSTLALEASRRVDWRFFLPDPDLGRVAFLEPVDELHVNSLRYFSESVTIVNVESIVVEMQEAFDLVIASQPEHINVEKASALVKMGGYFYMESRGLPFLTNSNSNYNNNYKIKDLFSRRPSSFRATFLKLGFDEVFAHWHWPDFDTCTKIIPLDNRAALRHTLSIGGRTSKARLRATIGRILVGTNLIQWVVPYFSLIARRGNK